MNGRLILLGTGTSFGVPVIGCQCDVCTSDDPRDRRTRVAAVIETADKARILVDTPPELRLQLVAAGIGSVDAVLYTHDHADHVHGIDDLRAVSVRNGNLPVYGPRDSLDRIRERFSYIFDPRVVAPRGSHKPELTLFPLESGRAETVAGVELLPLAFGHGDMTVFGYRVGPLAYLTDVKTVSDEAIRQLAGVRTMVVNGLLDRPHPTHLSISEAVALAQRIGATQTFLTHLTHRFSHRALIDMLPSGVRPAHDGLCVEF